MSKSQGLNERSLFLLKALVERYIQDGQPVGSRVLSKDSELNLSPATIRNVMSDLEELGLIHSPHTSAGRVPTVTGYRMFVDSLLTVKPLDTQLLSHLSSGMASKTQDAGEVIGKASQLLSDLTQMAGVVTLPRREATQLRHIEFLPLSNARVLVIYVTNEEEVHNKIIHTDREFSTAELQQASNYLTSVYSGQSLHAVREAVLQELDVERQQVNQAMIDAVNMAQQALDQAPKEDYVLSGQTNLMGFTELSDVEQLKKLFDAFNQKRGVIHLLDKCQAADGVQIYIGEESGYQAFDQCSLVTSSYSVNDEVVGVLGVIGPTRMSYEKVIPFVDVTAKLLSSALNPKG